MICVPDWWRRPRRVRVVVDNPGWIVPYARQLVSIICQRGDKAIFVDRYSDLRAGEIAFFLGCTGLCPPAILKRNRKNLVVHESDLPHGRGFAPVAWQILDGQKAIPVCLIEADKTADFGLVVLRGEFKLEGHELIDEIREMQASKTSELCLEYLSASMPPDGKEQQGAVTSYRRRTPEDSELNSDHTLADQFDLLRVVDNDRYPAFFIYRGHRYELSIRKAKA